jgi:hypothetical protein
MDFFKICQIYELVDTLTHAFDTLHKSRSLTILLYVSGGKSGQIATRGISLETTQKRLPTLVLMNISKKTSVFVIWLK